jgi:hypothetical protein
MPDWPARIPLAVRLGIIALTAAVAAAASPITTGAPYKPETFPVRPAVHPERVEVQRLVLPFGQTFPYRTLKRTRAEADSLARALLESARRGADFDTLVKRYSYDRFPAIYRVAGRGIRPGPGERPWSGLPPAVADSAFSISPGNIQLIPWDPKVCRYGFEIIRRLK